MTIFHFDGVAIEAPEGMSVAAALMQAGIVHVRDAPADGGPRGAFCLMGVCQECLVAVDGTTVEACRLPVTAGLDVQRLHYMS